MVKIPKRVPPKSRKKTGENTKSGDSGYHPPAAQLTLFPVKEVEVDGVAMGILSDGTPYLTLRGLARMCGVAHTVLMRLASNWLTEQKKPRGAKIKDILDAQGYKSIALNVRTSTHGVDTHVYTDAVCMAILEYYAFDAEQASSRVALKNYRLLARKSFRSFIYSQCKYDPDHHIPDSWRNFHERLLINDEVPVGHFSVFREIAELVLHMIKAGCPLDDSTVPDISVGIAWSNHWDRQSLGDLYGDRQKHPHNYPEWYSQASQNPVPAWIYPAGASGAFHTWLYRNYLPDKFPRYIKGKVKSGVFLPARADQLLNAISRPELPDLT